MATSASRPSGPKLRAMFSWNNGKDDDADMATFTGKIGPWLMWLIRLIAESFTRPLPLRVAVIFCMFCRILF